MTKSVAILGWYHKQNLGDDLLQRALEKLLSEHQLTFFGHMPPPSILNHFDYVILGGGSHWPQYPFVNQYRAIRHALRVPFAIVGISSKQALSAEDTDLILKDARLVIVRDQATVSDLHRHPKIIVAPDLTWMTPLPLAQVDPHRIGVNLRDSGYPPEQLSAIVKALKAQNIPLVPLPFFEGHYKWEKRHPDQDVMTQAGLPTPNLPTLMSYRQVSLVVGMRFHSLVLAAQAGVPFIGFRYHPKTSAFCHEMGFDDLCVEVEDRAEFSRALDTVLANYDAIRSRVLEAREPLIKAATETYQLLQLDVERVKKREVHESQVLRLKSHLRYLLKKAVY